MVLIRSDDGAMPSPAPTARTVPADVQAASELLTALASPVRLSIVALLFGLQLLLVGVFRIVVAVTARSAPGWWRGDRWAR